MVGGVKKKKTQQRSTQGGAAQQCLKRLMWVDSQLVGNEQFQKTRQGMPSLHGLLRSFHSRFFWVFLRSDCSDPIVGDMLGFRMTDKDSNEADGNPQPPRWCYPPQQETRGYSKAVTLTIDQPHIELPFPPELAPRVLSPIDCQTDKGFCMPRAGSRVVER